MSLPQIDKQVLKELVPINALSPENFLELLGKAVINTIAKGRYAFKNGDKDQKSVYVIDGSIELLNESGNVIKQIKGGSRDAKHPLAPKQPRQFSARIAEDAVIAYFDTNLLDLMLTWDQTSNYDVVELNSDSGGEHDDWMTKLLQTKAFHQIPPANLQNMFMAMEPINFNKGDVVIRQGEEGDYFYIISTGKCQIIRETPNKPEGIQLATLSKGDSFGEEALVSATKRNATIRMLTDGSLMRLSKSNFDTLLKAPLVKTITLDETKVMLSKGAQLLDVRLQNEFEKWSVKGSMNIPLYLLRNKISTLKEDKQYIVACDTGKRSSSAGYILSERGFDVYVLENGLQQVMPQA